MLEIDLRQYNPTLVKIRAEAKQVNRNMWGLIATPYGAVCTPWSSDRKDGAGRVKGSTDGIVYCHTHLCMVIEPHVGLIYLSVTRGFGQRLRAIENACHSYSPEAEINITPLTRPEPPTHHTSHIRLLKLGPGTAQLATTRGRRKQASKRPVTQGHIEIRVANFMHFLNH